MSKGSALRRYVKLLFWIVATAAIFGFAIQTFVTGQLTGMYFYKAKVDGYAIDDKTFANATPENPVILKVESVSEITGPQAVPVKAGDLLPKNTNGVISTSVVKEGKRVALENDTLKVMLPNQATDAKGSTTKDTFHAKNVETNPISGIWNLIVVVLMGLCLGLLAESVTDVLGIKVTASAHGH